MHYPIGRRLNLNRLPSILAQRVKDKRPTSPMSAIKRAHSQAAPG